jgi:subtilisin family serine protease
VTVNAVDKSDNEYSLGNWHDVMVDLIAPGVRINSAGGISDIDYNNRTGTSMAAPHVAGAWAIMKQFDPNLTVDEILELLQGTGTMITSSRCADRIPKARLDIGNTLTILLTVAPPRNLSAVQKINRSLLQTEYINDITWEANPFNQDKNITEYKIYRVQGEQLILLAQVNASTFTYRHRGVEKEQTVTYAATAVNDQGQESPAAYYTLVFNQ